MSLKRFLLTVAALVVAAVVCVESRPSLSEAQFLRVDSSPEQQAAYRTESLEIEDRAYQLYQDDNWKHYDTKKVDIIIRLHENMTCLKLMVTRRAEAR